MPVNPAATAVTPTTPATPAVTPAKPPAVVDAANSAADTLLDAMDDDVLPPFPAELEALETQETAAGDVAAEIVTEEAGEEVPAQETVEGEEVAAEGEATETPPEETPAEEVAEPAPAPPTEDPKAAEKRQQREAAQAQLAADYTQWEKDFAACDAALSDAEFDPLANKDGEVGAQKVMKTLAEGMKILKSGLVDLATRQEALASERQVGGFWRDWGAANPQVGSERGEKIFGEEMAKAKQKYPTGDPAALRMLATEKWEARLTQIRAQAKNKPTAAEAERPATPPANLPPKTPANPPTPVKPKPVPPANGKPPVQVSKSGQVVPRGTTARPPAPKPKTDEDAYAAAYREVGSVSGLLDE